MSADGKIADVARSPARFGSERDRLHLETQLAQADAFLFGASTLRAYGTTLQIRQPPLLNQRQQRKQPPQPVHIVCSQSGQLNPSDRFFSQPVTRWLLTSQHGAGQWRDRAEFEQVMAIPETDAQSLNLSVALEQLGQHGIQSLVIGGGGRLVSSCLDAGLIDEMWLTVCPLWLGGADAPTPMDGIGYLQTHAPRLKLLSSEAIADEVFLHYRVLPSVQS
jgi:5-amino-6-(5-phosphoribosylamino)uracil reductase